MPSTIKREFIYEVNIADIKGRNARVRELTAEGWNVKPGGSKRAGFSVQAWKGEEPYIVRHTIGLSRGVSHEVVALYRRADGRGAEYADGTPEYPER